jgi:hypothetical protein
VKKKKGVYLNRELRGSAINVETEYAKGQKDDEEVIVQKKERLSKLCR